MHVSDGILSFELSMALNCCAAAGVWYSSRKLKPENIPAAGIATALIFILSSIHLPIGAFSFHMTFAGLAGMVLGRGSIVVIFVSLLFQLLFLQHGGLVALGTNLLVMGAGSVAGILSLRFIGKKRLAGFVGGFAGVLIPTLMLGLLFYISGYGKGFLYLLFLYLLPAFAEAFISAGVLIFLEKSYPSLLKTDESIN